MKSSKLKKVIIGFLAVLVIIFIAGYFLIANALKGEKIQVMDFDQELNLKKPVQVKTDPAILFLGNSMTYVNDLPTVFMYLSQSGGFVPDVYELTEGSYRLEYFADETDEMGAQVYDALKNYNWDYVILQEQSGIAAMGAEESMYPAARTLDSMIRNAKGESVFLMTWAYKEGYSFNLLGLELKNTREEMQTQMAQNYMSIANELDAMLAPAGIAFMRCTDSYPEIELWDEDMNHPSPAGTYLTACVLYKVLYDQSPEGLGYLAGLDAQTAAKIQLVAAGIK
ncbi:SGNH/GDSL hydrolase family protein [Clostridium sp. Marseille-P2415]|uniref:SGNH/GDSL hydrolase family protein n=1 Tax=Clostridium sp. Marseille-P2415 TaxID=1805471 RepID=UPI000988636E|nr:SGNH/GDSL hydrolase family protein [Clostridium sp. Marseille-P2415]